MLAPSLIFPPVRLPYPNAFPIDPLILRTAYEPRESRANGIPNPRWKGWLSVTSGVPVHRRYRRTTREDRTEGETGYLVSGDRSSRNGRVSIMVLAFGATGCCGRLRCCCCWRFCCEGGGFEPGMEAGRTFSLQDLRRATDFGTEFEG